MSPQASQVSPRGRHSVATILIARRHQHPFTTNQVKRIEPHFFIVYLFHITKHIKSGWQGRCKPNAIELALFAEVQPVLANLFAKVLKNEEYLLPLCQVLTKY
jgi:hypothetical protein